MDVRTGRSFGASTTPHEALLRRAFSLIPAYLETPESEVRNYMDYGVQLGRRFRGLKLWFVLRAYGRRRIVEILRNHVAWAQELARWIGEAGDFETLAPHPLSVVCFRHLPARLAQNAAALDQHNQRVVDEINRGGFAFLSTTRLNERVAIRFAIGNARTTPADVRETWDLLLAPRAVPPATDSNRTSDSRPFGPTSSWPRSFLLWRIKSSKTVEPRSRLETVYFYDSS